jgi:hypothetical protein
VIDEENDFFIDLRIYFAFMKESYLTINNVCSDSNNIDLVKMILDQNYGLLGERYKREILEQMQNESKHRTAE